MQRLVLDGCGCPSPDPPPDTLTIRASLTETETTHICWVQHIALCDNDEMSHDSVTKPHDRWGAVTESWLADCLYWPMRGLDWPIRGPDIVTSVGLSCLFTSGPVSPAQLDWRQEVIWHRQLETCLETEFGHFLGKDSPPPRVAQYSNYSDVIWEENLPKIFYKSERNLLIRNLLSRVNCLKIRLEIYSKFGANIFQIIFEHFRNNADTQHFSVLKGYLRFSRHFLVDTLI